MEQAAIPCDRERRDKVRELKENTDEFDTYNDLLDAAIAELSGEDRETVSDRVARVEQNTEEIKRTLEELGRHA